MFFANCKNTKQDVGEKIIWVAAVTIQPDETTKNTGLNLHVCLQQAEPCKKTCLAFFEENDPYMLEYVAAKIVGTTKRQQK